MSELKFIHEDSSVVAAETQAMFEALLGRQMAPADTEMFLVNGLVYREMLLRSGINHAGRQNLVNYSTGAALDYLGELVGVSRLPAELSFCEISFTIVEGHTGVIIPEGIRIQSVDGKIIFSTVEEKVVPVGVNEATVGCVAQTEGIVGNGYEVGKISIILDPLPYLAHASNTTVPNGGADSESDEALRARIKQAPGSFSVAGPVDAYKFYAKSANAGIADVAVVSPINTGDVYIYVLMIGETTPGSDVIDQVLAVCNADNVRPTSDRVIVQPVDITEYNIEVNLTILPTAKASQVQAAVYGVLNEYVTKRKNSLGLDVVRSKLVQLSKIDGVYDVNIVSPVANIVLPKQDYAKCMSITVIVTGVHDE